MSILDKRVNYKPFEYPELLIYPEAIRKQYWVVDEVTFTADKLDYNTKLTLAKQMYVKRAMLCVSQIEVDVKLMWQNMYQMFPKPEVNGLGVSMAESEFRHSEAYSELGDVLGYNDELSTVLEIPQFKKLHDFLARNLSSTNPFDKVGVFTLLIEKGLLFGMFAIPYSLTRFEGVMKNISNIIAWTSVDEECFHKDTEVLTPEGWIFLREMSVGDEVYGFKEGSLIKEEVLNTTNKHSKTLIKIGNDRHSCKVTPKHDMITYDNRKNEWIKTEADTVLLNNHYSMPVTVDFKSESLNTLTPLDRLKIAIQADGTLNKWTNKKGDVLDRGVKGGYNYTLRLKKERKKERLRSILNDTNVRYIETVDGEYSVFKLHIEPEFDYKTFEWVNLNDVNKTYCEEFIDEVLKWDGHESNNEKCYTSISKPNIDKVQVIAVLAGYRTSIYENKDSDRSENFNNCYKLSLSNKDKSTVLSYSYSKETEEYNDEVYCITVPSGGIVTRLNGEVFISGNCHAQAGAALLNILQREFPFTPDQKEEYQTKFSNILHEFIEIESELLDWVFEYGESEHLSKENLLNFVKRRVDMGMEDIGFKPVFNVTAEEYEPMEWYDEEIFADTLDDFFAKRPVEYTKHDQPVTDDDLY